MNFRIFIVMISQPVAYLNEFIAVIRSFLPRFVKIITYNTLICYTKKKKKKKKTYLYPSIHLEKDGLHVTNPLFPTKEDRQLENDIRNLSILKGLKYSKWDL